MIGSISKKIARRLVLHAQLLDGRTKAKKGKTGVAQVVDHLGYVQIDTISVIERAHHHTLWTRMPGYRPEHLHQAHASDRAVFEYWGHAASYLPLKDYRFYLPMMKSFYNPKNSWYRGWGERYGGYLEPVLRRIREEGPLAARDFENLAARGPGPWWDWKPAKAALETLFWRGELMIRERRGFERVYDLSERVLPADTDVRMPTDEDLGRFIVQRALGALGIAGEREIRDYIRIGDRRIVAGAISEMAVGGEIASLTIEGQQGKVYALPAVLDAGARLRTWQPRVRFLSPFDNLAINRLRLKERFGFDYAFECYVPKAKRNHGYFVLPILFGEELVGRLDSKADRANKTLIVRRLSIAPAFIGLDSFVSELGRALGEFARFNGCETIRLESIQPKKMTAPLNKAITFPI